MPFSESDKGYYLDGYNDFDLVVGLMTFANLKFKPKGCFRVLCGKNANNPKPPLIVDFATEYHRNQFLIQCRAIINEFEDMDAICCRITRTPHWIRSISIAPDRSFEDRQRHKALNEQLTDTNNESVKAGQDMVNKRSLIMIDPEQSEGGLTA